MRPSRPPLVGAIEAVADGDVLSTGAVGTAFPVRSMLVNASTSRIGRSVRASTPWSLRMFSSRPGEGCVCKFVSASLVANVRAKGLYGAPFPLANDVAEIPCAARVPYLMLKSASSGPSSSAALESLPSAKPGFARTGVPAIGRRVLFCDGASVVSGDRGGVWILTRFFAAVRADWVAKVAYGQYGCARERTMTSGIQVWHARTVIRVDSVVLFVSLRPPKWVARHDGGSAVMLHTDPSAGTTCVQCRRCQMGVLRRWWFLRQTQGIERFGSSDRLQG
jgi:hypothetical protein